MHQHPPKQQQKPSEDEPDITMTDAGQHEAGEDPDFDEAGKGIPDAQRDEDRDDG